MLPRRGAEGLAMRRRRGERLAWARGLPVGRFEGGFTLTPVGPERFWLTPRPWGFAFIRANGERIEPGEFETDGGSVNTFLQLVSGVTRWGYYLAFPIHDWEYQRHHEGCTKSFEEVNLTLAEAMKTMQATGLVPPNLNDLINVYDAVMSPVGRAVWDGRAQA